MIHSITANFSMDVFKKPNVVNKFWKYSNTLKKLYHFPSWMGMQGGKFREQREISGI